MKSKYFKIVKLEIENFKKIRAVEIRPEGRRIIEVTGGNGEGKSSVIQSIDFAVTGVKALPSRKSEAVRNGTDRSKIRVDFGEFSVVRTIGKEGNQPTLLIDPPEVRAGLTPQQFLDQFFTALTFDPLEFCNLPPKEQVAELQRAAKVDIDFDKIAEENETDYKERTLINREIATLEAQKAGIVTMQGLPKQKVDEDAISQRIAAASAENEKAMEVYKAKQALGVTAANLGVEVERAEQAISEKKKLIEAIKAQLRSEEEKLTGLVAEEKRLVHDRNAATKKYEAAPDGKLVDMNALTMELTSAQRTNRAIDERARYDKLDAEIRAKQTASDNLSHRMKRRDEKKAEAIANAKIPVPGVTFDASGVRFNGMTLDNLGEGEQIRIATLIGMAANPKLHIICIRHGEALDGRNLKILADLAEEHDFQIWMAKVDTTGTAGFVMEDGLVVKRNAEVASDE